MSIAPAILSLNVASDDEQDAISRLTNRLSLYIPSNLVHESYYDGSFTVKEQGFSIPPNMRDIGTVVGWGGTVVDVLDERLDWLGWRQDGDAFGLSQMYAENQLDVESGMCHLDSLIYGMSFVAVGTGATGEPETMITAQSPMGMTGEWDRRLRRLSHAIAISRDEDGQTERVTLYTPRETATFESRSGGWVTVDRDQHNIGRCAVVAMPNRMRASDVTGRSEITSTVRYYTDAAVRTLTGAEVHREFYQAPQRWAMNVSPDAFEDAAGNRINPWHAIQGRTWIIPPNEDGEAAPSVGQFTPSSPTPYIEQVRSLATLLAAEAGLPSAYLGYATDNPASADAIRAGEARLVKRAERRQSVFGQAWLEVARLALLMRDGSVPDDFSSVSVRWRDAATPTRAAAADETVKLIGAGVLGPDSTVTYDRVGLDPDEQRQVTADKRRSAGASVLDRIAGVTDGNE